MKTVEEWARIFHETYERLAPEFGYITRKETKEFIPGSRNANLMIAVCDELINQIRSEISSEQDAQHRITKEFLNLKDRKVRL